MKVAIDLSSVLIYNIIKKLDKGESACLINLKKIREREKIDQVELAQKLGVCQSSVSMWETGKSNPRADILLQIANLLNTTVEELYKEE